jgi:hypothetical protein
MVFLVSACGRGLFVETPTIGPVEDSDTGGGAPYPEMTLRASTNCAAIGEEVVFTLQLVNRWSEPLTWPDSQPLDLVLIPAARTMQPPPIRRWSETRHYPRPLDPVIQPGEIRTYQWHWIAEPAYGQPDVQGVVVQVLA